MAHAWKACWSKGLEGSNPSSSAFARRSSEGRRRVQCSTYQHCTCDFNRRASADKVRSRRMYYVYLLECKDGPYTGCTSDLKDRMPRHHKGQVPATANRRPLELEAYFAFKVKYVAFEFEKYLKSGSGRAFMKKHVIEN